MRVLQSLNQNALLVREEHSECIVVGKGIGFGKKKGDLVDNSLVNKIYQMVPERADILQLFENVAEESIQMAEEVTEEAQKRLGRDFTGNFILSLASHIDFLEDKYQGKIEVPKPFHYELKYLYPKEYRIAEWAVDYLKREYLLNMPEAEISFFTLHFVNAMLDQDEENNVVELSDILNEIVELLGQEIGHPLNCETIDFSRFIIHLRYFIIRNINGKKVNHSIKDKEFRELYSTALGLYPYEYKILIRIKAMLQKNHQMKFGNTEDFYLLLHLVRIINQEGVMSSELQ